MLGTFLFIISFSGCDDVEPIPAYLHIASIDLAVNADGSQGDNTDDIVDAWVFVDGQEVGTFELPATIPVLHSGSSVVTVLAGIKKNGLNTDRVIYPFYEAYEVTMELIPSQVDTLRPVVKYREGVTFPWLENFEDNSISLTGSGSGTTDSFIITEDPEDVFNYDGVNNLRSGETIIGNGFQRWENSSVDLFDLPRIGQDIYLEINFKCNTEFVVGIYPINSPIATGVPIVNFFSTADSDGENMQWKKAYVSLKEDVNNPEFQNAEFKVFFNTQSNQGSATKIFLDNIKLIHF